MDQIKTIVCGIDFSDGSRSALQQAFRIAQWNHSHLIVVHVIDENAMDTFPYIDIKKLKERVGKDLNHFVSQVIGSDYLKVEQKVIFGSPYGLLEETVEEKAADLLVLGIHGHQTEKGVPEAVGTVAKRCVRQAPCKVLLVRGDHAGPFEKILHCTDYSATANRAFEEALTLAQQDRATLEVIHATISPENVLFGMSDLYAFAELSPESIRAEQEKRLSENMKDYREAIGDLKVKSSIIESVHSVGRALIEEIKKRSADIVVLGTHGRGPIGRFFIGSTAEKVVASTPCSVLAVKPADFKSYWVQSN